jgi:serine/threonine protein kinase
MAAVSHADKLEVTSRLGRGAFAVVYRGRMGEKDVAIKVLRSDPNDADGLRDEASRTAYRLFCREAAVAKALGHHRCVVPIFA